MDYASTEHWSGRPPHPEYLRVEIDGLVTITTVSSDVMRVRDYVTTPSFSPPNVQMISFSARFDRVQVAYGFLQAQYENAHVLEYGQTSLFGAPYGFGILITGPDNTTITNDTAAVSVSVLRSAGPNPVVQVQDPQLAAAVDITSDSTPFGVIHGVVPSENWAVAIALGIGTWTKSGVI